MVGVAGFEPAAHWSQTSCATKLRYTPKKVILCGLKNLVSPQGFEPRTHGLEGRCSIQLSYEPTPNLNNGADDENRTHAISLEG